MDEADGKTCATCHEWRALTEFNRRARAKDGLQARCRACSRAWYQRNRAEHLANVRRRNDRVRGELQELVREHLLTHPCVGCGESDLRVLEFDHRDPATKLDAVGRLQGMAMSAARLRAEMAKCDVKCANCHRIRTMTDCGSWRVAAEEQRQAGVAAVLDEVLERVAGPG